MSDLLAQRQAQALAAIQQAVGTGVGEDSIGLFAEHHRDELPASYWQQHLGEATPSVAAIAGLLVFKSAWGEGDMEYVDFTLPGEVTDYVVSVHFDDAGAVDGMAMES